VRFHYIKKQQAIEKHYDRVGDFCFYINNILPLQPITQLDRTMETRTVKTVRIFLASSSELHDDRVAFADLIERLQNQYESRGYSFLLKKWEYLNPAYNKRRKQDEYNDVIKQCDVFLALFYSKTGKYTVEEFDEAIKESKKREFPLLIYFKDLKEQEESAKLRELKERIVEELDFFWGQYDTNDKLHLEFVLWLDSFLFGGKSEFKVENGTVTMGDVKVAQMSQLPFAANNDDYMRMYRDLQDFPEKIKTLSDRVKKYPDDQDFRNELNQALDRNEALTDEFEEYQQILLDTAKHIADKRQEQAGEKLQRAIDAFENGDLRGANAILREIAIDSEEQQHIEKYEKYKRRSDKAQDLTNQAKSVVHQDISALQLQAKTEMADVETPIDVRIIRVTEIYSKADDWAQRSDYDDASYIKLLFDYAKFLESNSRFEDAEHVYLRLIEKLEKKYGPDYTDNATAYHNIGDVYFQLGNTQKALELFKKALTIRIDVFGEYHPDTATSYNKIGILYYVIRKRKKGSKGKKEDYDKALNYLNKAKTIREKVFGTNHVDTADTYYSLSMVYNAIHNKRENERYLEKVIKIRKRKDFFDKGDLEKASYYDTLGFYLKSKENYEEALDYFKKALSIRKKNLGHDNISIANSYERIGLIYLQLGKLDFALDAFHNSLSIREITLGENHSMTAVMYARIAVIYKRQKKNDEAIQFYIKALESYQNSSEVNFEKTAYMFHELGFLYIKIGDYSKAIEFFNKLLDIYKSSPDENSGKSAQVQEIIGNIYRMQKDGPHAIEYYVKAVDNQKKWFGENHLEIAFLIQKIGKIYEEIGEIRKAIKYYKESIDILERVLGNQNLGVAKIYDKIGLLYEKLGEDSQANWYSSKSEITRINFKIAKFYEISNPKTQREKDQIIEDYIKLIELLKVMSSSSVPSLELAQRYFEIAEIYYRQGDNGQAISNATESLSIYENYYSDEHLVISTICTFIGSAYKAENNYAKAAEYYQKSLVEFQDNLGGSCPASFRKLIDYARYYRRIGEMYFLLGDYQNALKYHTEALQLVEKTGVINGFIVSRHFNIGQDYEGLEEFQEALNHYTTAFDYYNTKYGPDHPRTLRAKENIDRVEEKLRLGSSSE
jgi:tetratricopeptide (TPR) repeat protein